MKKESFFISAFVIIIPFFIRGDYELYDDYKGCMVNTKIICCNSREVDKLVEEKESFILKNENKPYTKTNNRGNTDGNLINGGFAAEQGKYVFLKYDGLYRTFSDMKTDWKKLSDDIPKNINVIGEWIYYIKDIDLYKVKIDGSCKTHLLKDKFIGFFIIKDNWLYCYDYKGDTLYKIREDGSDYSLLDNKCGITFTIDEQWIYYKKEGALWKISVDGANKTKILDENTRQCIVLEQWIYYTNDQNKLCRIKIDGTLKQVLVSEFVNSFNVLDSYIFYQGFGGVYKVSINGEGKEVLADKKEYWGSLCLAGNNILYFKPEFEGNEFEIVKK